MKKKILTYLLTGLAALASAQDYHVSHYDVATMYLNPALTGMYGRERGDYRVYFDQRSQWRALGIKPFLTTYLGYDQPFKQWGKKFGLGGFIINNNGGIGNYNTLTMMASVAYDILNARTSGIVVDAGPGKSRSDKHMLTVGLQLGLFYRSTNLNSLNYDVQYNIANNGGSFDQNISNNEAYNRLKITRFDANYGLHYRYIERGKKARPYANFSMSHLTRPNESLTGAFIRLTNKWIGQAACDI
jgi:type IX secretion system PorP/SprF family membrane protein